MAVNRSAVGASNRSSREADAEIDRALIERAQQGQTAAFRQLVERHQRRAFLVAVAVVRDEEEAREIVQEAFLRVFRGLAQFHGGSSFFTWFYRIVTNLAIDFIRKPGRRDLELDDSVELSDEEALSVARPDAVNPFDALHRAELAQAIQSALDQLSPYHRGVIVMREVLGMSYEEMAEAMEVSKGTIMSRLFHARKKLQKALGPHYEGEPAGASESGEQEPGEGEP